jgi:hypothetical protein
LLINYFTLLLRAECGLQEAAIAQYDKLMIEFYQREQMDINGDWSAHSVDRITSTARLGSRLHLRDILNRLGFELK